MGAFKALLGSHQPLREGVMDPSLPRLLAAMHRTVQLLLQYRWRPRPASGGRRKGSSRGSRLLASGQSAFAQPFWAKCPVAAPKS